MGYGELFTWIWKKAVQDDIEVTKSKVRKQGHDVAYKLYVKNTGKVEIEPSDKQFKEIYKDINDYTTMKFGKVERRIRELVLQEARLWPHNKHLMESDETYKELLAELTKEVKEFSKERMDKRWRRL